MNLTLKSESSSQGTMLNRAACIERGNQSVTQNQREGFPAFVVRASLIFFHCDSDSCNTLTVTDNTNVIVNTGVVLTTILPRLSSFPS